MKLDVIVAPTFLERENLEGCVCAVIDVLRATSTITVALSSGAVAVYPCLDIDEAMKSAASFNKGSCLLGGEDMGKRIPGFDLGNSPLEYREPGVVRDKHIVFYTSNGTGAIRKAYLACKRPVYIAALLNVSAISSVMVRAAVNRRARGIAIICSGRYGNPSAEDMFCAGLIVEKIGNELHQEGIVAQMMDGATIAAGLAATNRELVLEVVSSSVHGRYLQSIGFAPDLEFVSQVDEYSVVPMFDGARVVLS
ncbi:MAG: 2-phosphosulfolactate phosphatase [Chloroflexota bacterium]|nr:2-phosphosulfolactate phosphatase [Chloroflexota bacterium]